MSRWRATVTGLKHDTADASPSRVGHIRGFSPHSLFLSADSVFSVAVMYFQMCGSRTAFTSWLVLLVQLLCLEAVPISMDKTKIEDTEPKAEEAPASVVRTLLLLQGHGDVLPYHFWPASLTVNKAIYQHWLLLAGSIRIVNRYNGMCIIERSQNDSVCQTIVCSTLCR